MYCNIEITVRFFYHAKYQLIRPQGNTHAILLLLNSSGLSAVVQDAHPESLMYLKLNPYLFSRHYAASCDCGDVAGDVVFEAGDVCAVGLVAVVFGVLVCGELVLFDGEDVSSVFTSLASFAVPGDVAV